MHHQRCGRQQIGAGRLEGIFRQLQGAHGSTQVQLLGLVKSGGREPNKSCRPADPLRRHLTDHIFKPLQNTIFVAR